MTTTTPLVDFDLAIFAPSPPSRPSATLDEATVERALDAIRAEFRAAKARLDRTLTQLEPNISAIYSTKRR